MPSRSRREAGGSAEGADSAEPVGLLTIAAEWARIGITGFGGPPAHIALLRRLCVQDRSWLSDHEFEDGIAAVNLLPGPASTQLAIFCAWRLRGWKGALVGGACFIVPGLVLILALSALFLRSHPPLAVAAAAAGAAAAVPAVALNAAISLVPGSWGRAARATHVRPARVRWVLYLCAGGVAAGLPAIGPYLVVVLVVCGLAEVSVHLRQRRDSTPIGAPGLVPLLAKVASAGGLGALAWVALKVGALSFGGGFVIVPLMQHDAVSTYHWVTTAHFLDAVALGQVTPGPVVLTVAAVGYAASGVGGGVLAAGVAFAPSFLFVISGGRYFDRLRANHAAQAFLTGAGAAAIGSIAGAAVPLALAVAHLWQYGVLALAGAWLLAFRRGIVSTLVGAGLLGVVAVLAGAPV